MSKKTFVVRRDGDGKWEVTRMQLHDSLQEVRSGRADSHFVDLLEAGRRAEFLRERDRQPSHTAFALKEPI